MTTLNESVKTQLGFLTFSLCEADTIIAQRDRQIAELKERLAELETPSESKRAGKGAKAT